MRQTTLARLAMIPGGLWLLALFAAPWVVVVAVSVATTDILGRPDFGWHPQSYTQIAASGFGPIITRSLGYAALATFTCLVLGFTFAYTVSRYGGRYRHVVLLTVLIPWFVDYLIRIYSWIQIVGQGGLLASLAHAVGIRADLDLRGHSYTVVGGLVYNFLPYMVLALYAAIDQLDESVLQASRDLYAGPVATLVRVTVPCTLSGITSGCLLVFLPAVGDFATAQLLGTPKQYMIGNVIADQIQSPGGLPIGAGLTVVLIVLLAAILSLAAWGSRSLRQRAGVLHG